MLPDQKVEIKWNPSNVKYFKSLGYKFTKFGDTLLIDISELNEGSKYEVVIICDYCGKPFLREYGVHTKTIKTVNKDACIKCRHIKTQDCNEINHGVRHNMHIPGVTEILKQSFIDKYGVDNPNKVPEIREKIKNTNLEKYGFTTASQCDEIKQKTKEIFIEKFGVENPMFSEEILEKHKNIMLEKLGVENPFQLEEIREKARQTTKEIYGVENVFELPEFQELARKRMYEKGTGKCSNQQKYLHNLFGGELNYPVRTSMLDIAFPKDKVYIEYSGSGHRITVYAGGLTDKEFDKRELKRRYGLRANGWKQIEILSSKDKLPLDDKLIEMYSFALEYFQTGHTWIHFNIDNLTIKTSQFEKEYNYGTLRRITPKTLEEQEKSIQSA